MAVPYFVNPPRRRRRTRRVKRRTRKKVAARRRRRRVSGVVRSIRKRTGRNYMARRRRRRASRRRRYRRNPPFGRGMIGQAVNVLTGGAGVAAGKIIARQATGMLRLDPNTPVGIAGQLAVAIFAGTMAKKMLRLRGAFADGLVYGAAAGAAESALKLIAPGVADRLLGEYYEVPLGAYELSAYPTPSSLAAAAAREQSALMGAYAGTGLM